MVGSSTPDRSLAQRLTALAKADEVRTERAVLKRDLKAGRKNIFDLLDDPPWWLESMKIFDLLLAVPKYGRVKVNKTLQVCRISPSKTIGGMTDRQKGELISMLRR